MSHLLTLQLTNRNSIIILQTVSNRVQIYIGVLGKHSLQVAVLEQNSQLLFLYQLVKQLHWNLFHQQKHQRVFAPQLLELTDTVIEHRNNLLIFSASS